MQESIRNRLPGTIKKIIEGKILSEVNIATSAGEVAAVITTNSVKALGLKVGDSVHALVKATNVSISKDAVELEDAE